MVQVLLTRVGHFLKRWHQKYFLRGDSILSDRWREKSKQWNGLVREQEEEAGGADRKMKEKDLMYVWKCHSETHRTVCYLERG